MRVSILFAGHDGLALAALADRDHLLADQLGTLYREVIAEGPAWVIPDPAPKKEIDSKAPLGVVA